jgi:hypothetical protein
MFINAAVGFTPVILVGTSLASCNVAPCTGGLLPNLTTVHTALLPCWVGAHVVVVVVIIIIMLTAALDDSCLDGNIQPNTFMLLHESNVKHASGLFAQ